MQGIEKEYNELDTVWFMAGSLFKNYPYDVPTEAFSLELFTQAFAAVQASVVHLQDVTLSKRFAMVPLGPPLLSYSSTSKVSLCPRWLSLLHLIHRVSTMQASVVHLQYVILSKRFGMVP